MQRLTITIPKQYNDGTDIGSQIRTDIETDLVSMYGGFTRTDVYGQWKDESGTVHTDESYRYEILTSIPHAYNTLCQYACTLCRILDQQSILCTCGTVQVDFV